LVRRLFQILFVALLAGLLVLSLYPSIQGPDVPEGGDKLAHFLMYFTLAAVGAIGWPSRTTLALLALPLLGFGLEVAQIPIPGRGFEWGDALANSIGAFCGVAVIALALRVPMRRGERV